MKKLIFTLATLASMTSAASTQAASLEETCKSQAVTIAKAVRATLSHHMQVQLVPEVLEVQELKFPAGGHRWTILISKIPVTGQPSLEKYLVVLENSYDKSACDTLVRFESITQK